MQVRDRFASDVGLRRVVVSGLASSTSLGAEADSTWQALLNSESGIGFLDAGFDLPVRTGARLRKYPSDSLTRVELRRLSNAQRSALVLARELWRASGNPDVDPDRLGVSIGTSQGAPETMTSVDELTRNHGYRKVSPLAVQMMMPNGPSAVVGLELGARAGALTASSACSSGAEAIANAWRMIVMGDADMVVTGGVEGSINAVSIASLLNAGLVSTCGDPATASRPFDRDRDGLVFGEAGALMILESEEHARARGAAVHARLLGAGITSDGFHRIKPDPEGTGAARAITRALETAGLTRGDITHVNAHAMGLPIGDLAEAKAIIGAVGEHPSVYAPKSALGHTMGAAGALEAVLTVLSIRDGIVPPTLNLDNPDPAIGLDVVAGAARSARIDYAVTNSFGFGGHNVVLAFGRV